MLAKLTLNASPVLDLIHGRSKMGEDQAFDTDALRQWNRLIDKKVRRNNRIAR